MAFHPYPQVIPSVFNRSGFGPPRGLTPASAWTWIDHPASRLRHATHLAILKTRFRCGSFILNLAAYRNSLAHSTKGTPSQCKDCSGRLRARGFRYYFTPLAGCFSPFPHGTCSLSVTEEYLALEGGPPCFPPGFTCPAVLWVITLRKTQIRIQGFHLLRPAFPRRFASVFFCNRTFDNKLKVCYPTTPNRQRLVALHLYGLGSCAFARRYSRNLG